MTTIAEPKARSEATQAHGVEAVRTGSFEIRGAECDRRTAIAASHCHPGVAAAVAARASS